MHEELGGYGGPGNPCGDMIPQCDRPGVCEWCGVVASVPKCVLPSTPCASEGVCVTETPCVDV